jgi:malic enzyme
VRPTDDVTDRHGLAMAYTPGVARVCTAIAAAPELAAEYTWHQPPHLSGRKRTLCAPGYVLR